MRYTWFKVRTNQYRCDLDGWYLECMPHPTRSCWNWYCIPTNGAANRATMGQAASLHGAQRAAFVEGFEVCS